MYSLDSLAHLDFELSSHCNSKCPQCPRYNLLGNVHEELNVTHLDFNTIKKIPIEKMKNLKEVSFVGNFGDPLMNPELDKIVSFFHKQQISISTNASLRGVEWWKQLGTNSNIRVTFCIDGFEDTHKLYRRNTSYKKIMENAKSFINAGGNARWQFIVFKHNEHQIEEAKTLSENMGFNKINFMYSDRFDIDSKFKVYENNKYLYDLEKGSKQKLLRERLNSEKGEKYWKELNAKKSNITCAWSKEKKIYIHSDSTVYPCCMLGSIQSGKKIEQLMLKKIIKDVRKIDLNYNTFEDIINSDVFTKALPESFDEKPFSHPICIEWCNKNTGKYVNAGLNTVNT